ncbi:MAG: phosphoenolpyruvate carboxykinase (ATP) [Coleofasciculus sp. S288]|nr:phosphoenolpyruvate carboxykinase (ATP) [Coleofasciculus sp. S288]
MNGNTYELESPNLENQNLVDQTFSQMNGQMDGTTYGLESVGLKNLGHVYRNLSVPQLVERASAKGEGILASNGAFCVRTGKYTGRSPSDKFIVDEPTIHGEVDWNKVNVPLSVEKFDLLYKRMLAYVQGRDLFVFDGYVGADPNYRLSVRVINELASHNLFAHQLFLRPTSEELHQHTPDFTVIAVPGLQGDPDIDGINSEAFIVLSFQKRLVLIGGSYYAGEIKKSVFSFMNYLMTKRGVLPMHCSANMDEDGNTALFFGLSGTGKTTLSADPTRRLIGDDEHGWSDLGIFNFEGGCYAKTIRLSKQNEPQIWDAIRFGAMLENVILNPETRMPDYDDRSLTENTRVAYPVEHIPNCVIPGVGGHPKTLIFLTADAFGVLPPIAKLTHRQAMYHFMSGYTSKVAGTERGVTEPQATFSSCFGQPFLPLAASLYGQMLYERIIKHDATVYLVNTGWTGGPYGVGERIKLPQTRAMVAAALSGALNQVTFHEHPIFKILVPETVPGVDSEILDPQKTWKDPAAYEQQAKALARRFVENFKQFHRAPLESLEAAPDF